MQLVYWSINPCANTDGNSISDVATFVSIIIGNDLFILYCREALRSAYCRLVEKQDGGGVLKFNRFLQLMSSYQPQLGAVYIMFCINYKL